MKKATIEKGKICPKCKKQDNQIKSFARKNETLYAVVAVFVNAYNRFGMAKYKYRMKRRTGELPFSVIDFL